MTGSQSDYTAQIIQMEEVIFFHIMHLNQNPTSHYDEIIFLYPQLKLAGLEQNSMIFNSYVLRALSLDPVLALLNFICSRVNG